jgi:hypothetical protein
LDFIWSIGKDNEIIIRGHGTYRGKVWPKKGISIIFTAVALCLHLGDTELERHAHNVATRSVAKHNDTHQMVIVGNYDVVPNIKAANWTARTCIEGYKIWRENDATTKQSSQ